MQGVSPCKGEKRDRRYDDLRLIAIALMTIDHGLFFFADESIVGSVVRLTLTRAAEPLFVFVLASLALKTNRSIRPLRLLQIASVGIGTSWILSEHASRITVDILGSMVLVILLRPVIRSMSERTGLLALYLTAITSGVPLGMAEVFFDYSPVLVLHQVLLVRLKDVHRAKTHFVVGTVLLLVSALCASQLGFDSVPIISIVLFGHSLALLIISLVWKRTMVIPTMLMVLSRWPLTVYAGHLAVFAMVSTFMD